MDWLDFSISNWTVILNRSKFSSSLIVVGIEILFSKFSSFGSMVMKLVRAKISY